MDNYSDDDDDDGWIEMEEEEEDADDGWIEVPENKKGGGLTVKTEPIDDDDPAEDLFSVGGGIVVKIEVVDESYEQQEKQEDLNDIKGSPVQEAAVDSTDHSDQHRKDLYSDIKERGDEYPDVSFKDSIDYRSNGITHHPGIEERRDEYPDVSFKDSIEYHSNGITHHSDDITNSADTVAGEPFLKIIEQPAPKKHRFRYPCEGPRAGVMLGARSTEKMKTFPAVKVYNLRSRALIIGSLVTTEGDKPHPFKLVGDNCKSGVVWRTVYPNHTKVKFENLGIQCAARKDLKESLRLRKELEIDPFNNIDQVLEENLLNLEYKVVRICFQVFLEDPDRPGTYTKGLEPVLSNNVYNKKDTSLKILRMNRDWGLAKGNEELFIFCEKIDRDDVQVEFYQEGEAGIIWRGYGVFGPADIHHQIAIVVKTPSYHKPKIDHAIDVKISLTRPSDDDRSEPKDFTYVPDDMVVGITKECPKLREEATQKSTKMRLLRTLRLHEKHCVRNPQNLPTSKNPESPAKRPHCEKALEDQEASEEDGETSDKGMTLLQCRYCEKCFSRLAVLKIHEKINTCGRPYQCKYCGKLFKW